MSQQHQADIIALLLSSGWTEDGKTDTEVVRVPTIMAPMGVIRQFGGRARFHRPGSDEYATVGPRSVCFYRRTGRECSDFVNVKTKDVEAVRARLASNGQRNEP